MHLRTATACLFALVLVASHTLALSERVSSVDLDANGDPVDLFQDPFAVDTMNSQESEPHDPSLAARARDEAAMDRFMMQQVQSQLAAAAESGTTASFTGVRNFVSQIYTRILTEQKIADDDAKAEVVACRANIDAARAKALAEMKKVHRINASLIHESELVRELPSKIAQLSSRVSDERKASLQMKGRIASLNKDRKNERQELKNKRKASRITLKTIDTVLANVRKLPIKLKWEKKNRTKLVLPAIPNPIELMRSQTPKPVGPSSQGAAELARQQNLRAAATAANPASTTLPGDVAVATVAKTSFRSMRADAPRDPMADIEEELDAARGEGNLIDEDDSDAGDAAAVEKTYLRGQQDITKKIGQKGSLVAADDDEEQDSAYLSLLEMWESEALNNTTLSSNGTNTTAEDLDGPDVPINLSDLQPLDADLEEIAQPAQEAIMNGLDTPNPDGDDPNRNPNVDANVTANATVNGTVNGNSTLSNNTAAQNATIDVPDYAPLEMTETTLKAVKKIFFRFVKLKHFFTKYMLQLDEQEKQALQSYFRKKRMLFRDYYLHFTEYRKAGRRRHWTILRLKRAKVLSKQRAASMQFHLPLFLLLKQQLSTLKKGCNDTEATLEAQSKHRAQTLDTITAILKVIDDRINGVVTPTATALNPGNTPVLPPVSLNAGSRNFSSCKELVVAGFTKSGIYTISDSESGRSFQAYCEMEKAGGGWMLAFKQHDFKSGNVKHSEKLYGIQPLLHTQFNSSSMGSILAYGKPKQLLFVASNPNNWFTTGSLSLAYQYWDISPTPRYCFYRPAHDSGEFGVSPTWNLTPLWSDTAIQLMDSEHPDISAVTVGQMTVAQKGPQCMSPHCSPNRHGRFEGKCQNNSKGEGNWMIFTR